MNRTPAAGTPEPDHRRTAGHRPGWTTSAAPAAEAGTVPRQSPGAPGDEGGGSAAGTAAGAAAGSAAAPPGAVAEPLDHRDPLVAADAAAVENLLRCWVRENDLPEPGGDGLRIALHASGTALLVPVLHWSPTGWHRFGPPVLEGAPADAPPADALTVAALLTREPAGDGAGPRTGGLRGGGGGRRPGAVDLAGRVADSVLRTAVFIDVRRRCPAPAHGADLFLTAEQSLVLGHPLHPTPKSREGLSEAEARLYSPELGASFPLHWLAVDRSVLACDSAWTEEGRTVPAERITSRLAGGLRLPPGTAALPLHPWQARRMVHRPEAAALFDAGLLTDLGPAGQPWHPTSSVRTVYRSGAPAMLKLSLGVRITNSRRENLRKELHRGVEVHRLLRGGLGAQWRTAHPRFDIVRDPAWLAVDTPDGAPLTGLDVMIRHNPFGPGDDAVCLAGLTAPRPWPGRTALRSRLAEVIGGLATRTGRPTAEVAAEWFLRYLDQVVRPVLWLDATAGVALEAHQQNILVILDPQGWPAGGRYRDNQGYYFRESRRAELDRRLPGIGALSDTFVDDAVTDERFTYYLAVNNVLGLIGAFGSQRLAAESVLLAGFRRFLHAARHLGSPLPAQLLDSPSLRCKANLLTRLHGLDELAGPVDTQSVYVTIGNPLHP
ncbi:IucA/IucC family protein [Streptomyces pacificus]|uniref:Iron transporter n=1 Tax=Streptomyces pacificus TaxID=2705029 RepID=A0A6A0B155_9ACTN|nr:IucA/IucC family protein [Streptomyces pacificus]GFH38425.1 iron transporter [Streptomyces pacificus]